MRHAMRNIVRTALFATAASFAAYSGAQGASAGLQAVVRDSAGVGRDPIYAVWRDLVVLGTNDRYEFRAHASDGRLARIVRREHEARRPTRADLDAHFARRYQNLSGPERSAALADVADMPLTDAFPAFTGIRVDELDHLWVEEYRQAGETRRIWTVFDPAGRVLGRLETPPGLRIFEIGPDYLLGATYDEFQIEYVQLWPLTRSGS
ncbi:MAG: hypothetical protein F4Z59_01000 [Gemmatimonadales bacterium]|nr:hypothetical protein [Gemmatimonadales bacterium]